MITPTILSGIISVIYVEIGTFYTSLLEEI
jgi:hypothetical protein